MAYSIRTRSVTTPTPKNLGVGGKPVMTAVSNSVGAIATVNTGQWSGPRLTFAYGWLRSAATITNATNASFSYQSAGTHTAVVTATNGYGSRSVAATAITIL